MISTANLLVVTSRIIRVIRLDSGLRGNEKYAQFHVMPAQASIQQTSSS